MDLVYYSHAEIILAYREWVDSAKKVGDIESLFMTNYGQRVVAWCNYVDTRDGLPIGTTHARSLRRLNLVPSPM